MGLFIAGLIIGVIATLILLGLGRAAGRYDREVETDFDRDKPE